MLTGKHILLEKPMATTIPDAYEILQIAQNHHAIGIMKDGALAGRNGAQRRIQNDLQRAIRACCAQCAGNGFGLVANLDLDGDWPGGRGADPTDLPRRQFAQAQGIAQQATLIVVE